MKKKKIKIKWSNIAAIAICISCLILSISNLWLHNETISFIIWPLLLVAMFFNFYSVEVDNHQMRNRWLVKANECIDWCWCVTMIQHRIRCIELPEEERQALLDFIEEQEEIVHANRTEKQKRYKLDEDEV